MIGQVISHYRILEKLGEGGMGIVYKAHDTRLDRVVAIKFLSRHLTPDKEKALRFLNEARTSAALLHPNVALTYEIGEHDGEPFLVMEYVDGKTLSEIIHDDGPLPVEKFLDIALQIADGLAAIHEKRIIHRDLKSENILLTSRGQVKITDCGLAKFQDSIGPTQSGAIVGTFAYMSPEQVRGEPLDNRCDIFSLGAILYELLTGKLPFGGNHPAAVMYSIVYEEPLPIPRNSAGNPMVPPGLERIIRKALDKQQDRRYRRVEELHSDLLMFRKEGDASVGAGESQASEKRRIAVLPLANISANPTDDFFADGMTEELISRLSKINGLRVIARTSIMQYKQTTKSMREIGKELRVTSIMEGSVRVAGNKLRISVQLVESQSEERLWSENYERDFNDVFGIQSDVAQRVAQALMVQLGSNERGMIEKEGTHNITAYTAFLKGRHFLSRRTEDGLMKSIELFQQAVDADSGYAVAYAAMAEAYTLLALLEFLPPRDAFPKAKSAAEQAIQIDASIAEAHAVRGLVKFQFDWEWEESERELNQALLLNPNYGTGHHYYADFLKGMGRFDEALAEIRRAQELDPLSLAINTGVGHVLYLKRQFDEAIEQYRRTLELDPNFLQARLWFGRPYLQKGMYEEAIAELKAAVALAKSNTIAVAMLGHAYAVAGQTTEALNMLEELKARSLHQYVSSYWIGMIYIGLGDKDESFRWLQKAVEERSSWLAWIRVEPRFDILRSDARFAALLGRMRL